MLAFQKKYSLKYPYYQLLTGIPSTHYSTDPSIFCLLAFPFNYFLNYPIYLDYNY